jgi:hypothetical protein
MVKGGERNPGFPTLIPRLPQESMATPVPLVWSLCTSWNMGVKLLSLVSLPPGLDKSIRMT